MQFAIPAHTPARPFAISAPAGISSPPRRQRSLRERRMARAKAAAAALVLVAVMVGVGVVLRSGSNVVSLGEYQRLREGMTLQQVDQIVGKNGKALSSGPGNNIYFWENADGSNMMATFDEDNRVTHKTEDGLR